ncbi:MAG: hypothetical protein PUH03_03520 [bacterium]|nr:hypothetical protein [bacterium]MDY2830449.1 hypothetical protein [Alphaproteobacteria bacterium]
MVDFTDNEQIELKKSPAFREYLETTRRDQGANLDEDVVFNAYLRQRGTQLRSELDAAVPVSEQAERLEKEIENYLETVYVDEKSATQDITRETWDSPEYLAWKEDYAKNHPDDADYLALKQRLDALNTPADSGLAVNENDTQNDSGVQHNDSGVQYAPTESGIVHQDEPEETFRERSPNSDANEFTFDKAKLQTLLDLDIISQSVYDEAIKNPAAAIEQLQAKLPLSDKKQAEYESALSDKMLETPELFELMPPSLLAKEYTKLNDQLKEALDKNPEADVSALREKVSKLADRMDTLSSDLHDKQEFFFADVTNIADTYDGYMAMFDAREQGLDDSEQSEKIKTIHSDNRETLNTIMAPYDDVWNLTNLKESDADSLDSRFNELSETLEKTELDAETLKLVSNFKFFDENDQPEPQFVDKDGNKKDTFEEGDEIIKGSKLDTMVRIARQNVLMRQIGSNDDVSVENLNENLKEELPTVLYAAHVAAQTEKGIKEDPKQFTDPAYLDQFKEDLSNSEKPMGVSATAYEATIDNCINGTAAYATRLGTKIGKDKPIVTKVFEPLEDLDKRAGDRTTETFDKRKVRIQQLKRAAKGAMSAFLVSGAITVVGAATAADVSMTAATLGMNKYAGMALGSALAIGMTLHQIHRWRKDRKAHGEKAGFWAMLKDRRLRETVETTALGCAALGFAVTGNPGIAQWLGYGAMALGTANNVINSYQDVKKAGLSGLEAFGWAALQATATIGGGMAGRYAANAGIDTFNKANPENEIFQHKETSTTTTIEQTTVYKPEAIENAHKILDYWYKDNPELLQQRIDAINSYNDLNGTDINPERYLLAAHDAGALSADNNMLHVQDGADISTNANHKVLGSGWSNQTGVSQDIVNNLADSVSGDGVNITPESLDAFRQIDQYIGVQNHVGHVPGTSYQNDGVLGYNAEATAEGTVHVSENGDRWTTYANGDSATEVIEKIHDTPVTTMVRNESDLGLGMVGVLGTVTRGIKKLKDRVGTVTDKLLGKKRVKPVVTGGGILPTGVTHEGANGLSAHTEPKGLPTHEAPKQLSEVNKLRGLPTTEEIKLLPEHVESKTQTKTASDENIPTDQLLDKEYKIVHGAEPSASERLRYHGLVANEWRKNGASSSFVQYLQTRMDKFEETIAVNGSSHNKDLAKGICDTKDGKQIINEARQRMWKLPQGAKGTADETLITFQEKYVSKRLSNDGVRDATLSSKNFDSQKGPVGKIRQDATSR